MRLLVADCSTIQLQSTLQSVLRLSLHTLLPEEPLGGDMDFICKDSKRVRIVARQHTMTQISNIPSHQRKHRSEAKERDEIDLAV